MDSLGTLVSTEMAVALLAVLGIFGFIRITGPLWATLRRWHALTDQVERNTAALADLDKRLKAAPSQGNIAELERLISLHAEESREANRLAKESRQKIYDRLGAVETSVAILMAANGGRKRKRRQDDSGS